MRKHAVLVLPFLAVFADAQNIFTITGIPYAHRDDVDSQPALSAPLGNLYGLLIDNTTGRLILNNQLLVLPLEPQGTLLTLNYHDRAQPRSPFRGRFCCEGSVLHLLLVLLLVLAV